MAKTQGTDNGAEFLWARFGALLLGAIVGAIALAGILGCGSGTNASSGPTPTPAPTPTPTPTTPPALAACTVPPVTISHTSSSVNQQQLVVLDTTKYPGAVCNDGSAPAYVYRLGAGAASSRWVISLEGGNECGDQSTCSRRAQNQPILISSLPYQANPASVGDLSGLFSADPAVSPDFYDATEVHALYCSSDDWSGTKAGTGAFNPNDVSTWSFQGRAILKAILADITANHGFGSASEVMFTGDSAGGVGAYVNVNDVAKLVPPTARFVASSDAAFDNLVDNFSASGSPPDYTDPNGTPAEIAKRLPAITLWNGHGDEACAAAATTPTGQVMCYGASQLLGATGTITLPMLVYEAQQDKSQLATDGVPQSAIGSASFTTAEAGYISYFAAQMRFGLAEANAGVSIFSPDVLQHVEQSDSTLANTSYSFPSGQFTLTQVTGAWYRNPCTVQRDIAN